MKKNEIMVVVIAISSFIVGLSFSYEFFRIPAIIAAWIGGAAAAYIFLSAEESVNDEKEKINIKDLLNKLDKLKGNEKQIFEEIISEDGKVMQGILVEKSNLSKATVSRILDSLEGKGLIVRQRHGMNNIILLK
ncbi:hypothetical protein BEH94_00510 [Candidatus Altiarchaeales archaeon WOR_SM1_SCG]|nr:hypothetical protein BEH94_00510 [Candidatus Altiarchaeales archaeon WOR_SM1_SCG]